MGSEFLVRLGDVDRTQKEAVGGKGAQLGELSRIEGINVPVGFCVTTAAFRTVVSDAPSVDALLDRLTPLTPDDLGMVREISAAIRAGLEGADIPDDLARTITSVVAELGEGAAVAVRSSATAEDLPDASFAGQHDSYLNVIGASEVLRHVRRCWASLFSDRAVVYRMRHGIDHRSVDMAVVVQHMVDPQSSGVMFTADPVTGNRRVASVEATVGLGAALVSGMVNADSYRVRNGVVVDTMVAAKPVAWRASPGGGTVEEAIDPARQRETVLAAEQVVALVGLGRRIEEHFGSPQDIEWCLDDDGFQFVQSRPITTLFPIPEVDHTEADGDAGARNDSAAKEGAGRVYISVGHQQMMTDPMTPLGLSVWQLTSPAPMRTAGGRLFVDVTAPLSSPSARAGLLQMAGRSDPLIRDALETVLDRGDVVRSVPDDVPDVEPGSGNRPGPTEPRFLTAGTDTDGIDSEGMVTELIGKNLASVARLREEIRTRSGPDLFDFILDDLDELRAPLFAPDSHRAVMAGFEAAWWLNDKLDDWLGERNASAVLALSAPNNVTAEMGLALLDVADAIRPHPEVVAFLRGAKDDGFLDEMEELDGGREARQAIVSYLDAYGMRGVGEIDIARPRWREQPSALLPVILSNVEHFEPGESERRLERGRQEAQEKESELLERLRALPGGEGKAEQTKQMIDRMRTFIGYREYPKYGMVSRYFIYKQALMAEARRLVDGGLLDDPEDIFFLTFQELREVVRGGETDRDLIRRRRLDHRAHGSLTPPRVITSDGEALHGAYRRDDLPAGALPGLAVSGGTVEGRARVILDIADADLQPGDILVTTHTDPSWTPLFLTVAGLVTEVGGLMTHGAVIAREYGLTAVVGVENATRLIRDGQHIRVDGTSGHVLLM